MWKRAISVVTVVLFVVSSFLPVSAVQAAPTKTEPVVDVGSINVPSHLGSIASVHDVPGAEKTVIHIQDAHCNYSAQKNIQAILENVSTNNNVRLVGLEGAEKWVSTAVINAVPDKQKREEFIDALLNKAVISGGVAFAGNQDEFNSLLYGIENNDLYLTNLKAYTKLVSGRKEALRQISNVEDGLNALKAHMLNEKLLTLINKKDEYAKREISFSQYLADLAAIAKENGIALTGSPNIKVAVESVSMEDGIDFAKVNEERTELINDLSKTLVKEDLQNLVTASLQFRTGKIGSLAYYSYLETVVPKDRKCDDLRNYIQYVKLNAQLDSAKLSDERRVLEAKLVKALTKSEDETKLLALIESVDLVEKLVSIKLIRKEYNELLSRNVSLQNVLAFLYENSKKYSTGFTWNGQPAVWENAYKAGVDFYGAALKREDAFINNLVAQMDKEDLNVAALVSGGFHTSKIKELLAARDISYVVVRPRVTERTPKGLYSEVMATGISYVLGAHTTAAPQEVDAQGDAVDETAQEVLDTTPGAVKKGAEEGQEAVEDDATTDEVADTEDDSKDEFQWSLYAKVTAENAAVQAQAEALYQALTQAAGAEVIRLDADPGIMYFNLVNGQLEVSNAALNLLAALVVNGNLTDAQAQAVLNVLVLGHEVDHRDGERAADAIAEEIRVCTGDIERINALSDDADERALILGVLIQVARGQIDLSAQGVAYQADAEYADYLDAIAKGQTPANIEQLVRERARRLTVESVDSLPAVEGAVTVLGAEFGEGRRVAANGQTVADTVTRLPRQVTDQALANGVSSVVAAEGISGQAVAAAVQGEDAGVRADRVRVAGEAGERLVLNASGDARVEAAREAALLDNGLTQRVAQSKNQARLAVRLSDVPVEEEARQFFIAQLQNIIALANVSVQFVNDSYEALAENDVDEDLREHHTVAEAEEGAWTVRLARSDVTVGAQDNASTMFIGELSGRELILAALAGTDDQYIQSEGQDASALRADRAVQAMVQSLYQSSDPAQLNLADQAQLEAVISAIFTDYTSELLRLISSIPITVFDLNAYSIMRMMTSVAA